MPTKQEMEFHATVGTLIACDIAKVYAEGTETIFRERKDKASRYAANACKDAFQANSKLIDVLFRGIKALRPSDVKEILEEKTSLIYDIVAMSEKNQDRIRGLIAKLKKEEGLK
jgi:hypothetical protein